ncbi:glycosyltransferase family 4 protein [Thermosulfuriphilus ammonigenes]|uniref:Glycosyltransferase family 4 protein n=1 Tax=Thermosulfuriphilus ammonigenes TaxID=1936021 RepID=A0A6G7PXH6_9BACT|nr:glycosyltransferase family 4 protein [Thermosulfuriphilus ammonigenes]QIJ72362.1 glycosyltransferase family 4 protein [Thermosulfuriphilus ammonigenes]
MYKYLVSSHLNPSLSGVAKFNQILAMKLDVPCLSVFDIQSIDKGPILFSLKVRDLNDSECLLLSKYLNFLVAKNIEYDLFFHTFDGLDLEYELLKYSRIIYSGNLEIYSALKGINKKIISAWCPALITGDHIVRETSLNLFSFGMAHKLQLKYYKILQNFLENYNIDYVLWVSTAFHEKANFGDFDSVSNQLSKIFGFRIQFLGFLSDDAINYFLDKTQLFVAFFEKGVRANNTSIFAAMNRGCAIITNIDEYSPSWIKHSVNVLDIRLLKPENLKLDFLKKIGLQAKNDVQRYASWDKLIELFSVI